MPIVAKPVPPLTPAEIERFWSKVRRIGSCLIWQGSLNESGYGRFHFQGATHQAHRVAWFLAHGPIPPGLYPCHNCPDGDNPACVDEAHMFLGTMLDNVRDSFAKGRRALGDAHWTHIKPELLARGENHWRALQPEKVRHGVDHPMSKLTEENVRYIRHEIATTGRGTAARLSREFGVAEAVISHIKRGITWKHIM